jgi:Spy/CpxP family protein refolding chaperone
MTRKNLTYALAAVAALGIGAATLGAQPPGGPGHGGPGGPEGIGRPPGQAEHRGPDLLNPRFLARYLELTEEQREELKAILETHRDAVRPIQEEIRTLGQELRALLESESPDPANVGEIVLEIQALHQDVAAARQVLLDDIRASLTPEQQEKLDRILEILEALRDRGPRG